MPTDRQITELLADWGRGDETALEELVPLVYGTLRREASLSLRHERREHTLQPTALVHEAYLRLIGQRHPQFVNRVHFFSIAAQCMRRVLVDHARGRLAVKRGFGVCTVRLTESFDAPQSRDVDIIALDGALQDLAAMDPQKSRIVELRFFGGLSVDEVAATMKLSSRTVARQWRLARAWLYGQLAGPQTRH